MTNGQIMVNYGQLCLILAPSLAFAVLPDVRCWILDVHRQQSATSKHHDFNFSPCFSNRWQLLSIKVGEKLHGKGFHPARHRVSSRVPRAERSAVATAGEAETKTMPSARQQENARAQASGWSILQPWSTCLYNVFDDIS